MADFTFTSTPSDDEANLLIEKRLAPGSPQVPIAPSIGYSDGQGLQMNRQTDGGFSRVTLPQFEFNPSTKPVDLPPPQLDVKPNKEVAAQTHEEKSSTGSMQTNPRVQGQPGDNGMFPWSIFRNFNITQNPNATAQMQPMWNQYDQNVKEYLMSKPLRDPNSAESKLYQDIAKKATGDDTFANASGMQIKMAMPAIDELVKQNMIQGQLGYRNALLNLRAEGMDPNYKAQVAGAQANAKANAEQKEPWPLQQRINSQENAANILVSMKPILNSVDTGKIPQAITAIRNHTGTNDPQVATLMTAITAFAPEMAKIQSQSSTPAQEGIDRIYDNFAAMGKSKEANQAIMDYWRTQLGQDFGNTIATAEGARTIGMDTHAQKMKNILSQYDQRPWGGHAIPQQSNGMLSGILSKLSGGGQPARQPGTFDKNPPDLMPGDIVRGYKFKGGDKTQQGSWEAVK